MSSTPPRRGMPMEMTPPGSRNTTPQGSRPGTPSKSMVNSPMSLSPSFVSRNQSTLRERSNIRQEVPNDIVKYINDDSFIKQKHEDILQKIGSIGGINTFINITFDKYKYKGTNDKNIGIKVGLFELTPQPQELDQYSVTDNNDVWNEIANVNNNQIFKVESKLQPNLLDEKYKFFYFRVDSGPTYWETDDFDNMERQVYVFICTTHNYIPVYQKNNEKKQDDKIGYGHMWLTTVEISNGKYITNIFDTNSTNLFNYQYARKLEILTGIYILPRGNATFIRENDYIGYKNNNCIIYYLDCQNNKSIYYANNTTDCIGLQNFDKWGFCQTFVLIMYLAILHNPFLATEPLGVVIKRPGIYELMHTNNVFIFADKMLREFEELIKYKPKTPELSNDELIEYKPKTPGLSKPSNFGRRKSRKRRSKRSSKRLRITRKKRSLKKFMKKKI